MLSFPNYIARILVITLLATVSTSDSLVPPDHVHAETRGEAIATTATYLAASGTPTAFDNEAFSPAMPWARWWQTDESQMTAVQEMLRLGQNDDVLPGLAS